MNNPFFSIIVPVYQSKDFLQKTVNKLQKQTFKNIEIILIDDGSTDGSANICDSLAKNDKRIRVFHKINSGASAARNIGIKAARGKWIIFVDSDDIVSTAMCEAFFYYLKKYTLVDFIALNFASKDKLIKEVISISASLQLQNLQQNINLIQHILYSDYNGMPESFKKNFGNNTVLNSPCGKAYRKDFLLKNNIYFQKNIYYSEDLLFNIQILICEAKGVYLDEAVYFYRDNPKSVTKKIYVPNIVENYANFKKILDNLLNKKKINELKKKYRCVYHANFFTNVAS